MTKCSVFCCEDEAVTTRAIVGQGDVPYCQEHADSYDITLREIERENAATEARWAREAEARRKIQPLNQKEGPKGIDGVGDN